MRTCLLFFLFYTLSGCAATSTDSTSVEAEDLGRIVEETATVMLDCIKHDTRKACSRGQELLEKYPWLLTRKVDITNSNGMRANEWDVGLSSIKKNFTMIKANYVTFVDKTGQ